MSILEHCQLVTAKVILGVHVKQVAIQSHAIVGMI